MTVKSQHSTIQRGDVEIAGWRELAERCHEMDCAAVSQARRRMEEKISRNPRLAARAKSVAKQLRMSNVETWP
jgi:hypothetical protein